MEWEQKLEGTHLSLLHQCQNMKGNDSTVQSKTKHADKSCNLKYDWKADDGSVIHVEVVVVTLSGDKDTIDMI